MKQFHALQVAAKEAEARDALRISLDVPDELRDEYQFQAGQHLPIQIELDGRPVRRTYSICSAEGEWPLQIGVRVQEGGAFSGYAATELEAGDTLQVMPPTGRFHARPDAGNAKHYLGIAAGSGITPILSIVASLLNGEANSTVTLFYGNRTQASTMFIDDLYALKNRFVDRLQIHFLFSREDQEFDISSGRLDEAKVGELMQAFAAAKVPDEAFVCGPDTMIDSVSNALKTFGISSDAIHAERFGAPRRSPRQSQRQPPAADLDTSELTEVTVLMDGHRQSFDMPQKGINIVDAAALHGVELPYSCKGGVCATCRTHVRSGEVRMATNYGLEPWEVESGFVLACQSTPLGDALLLDYDKT